MKKTNTTANTNAWTFAADSLTVKGTTLPASYSVASTGDVYVFAQVKADAASPAMPIRLHIGVDMPMHAAAKAAAESAQAARRAEVAAKAAQPAPVQESAPAKAPAKKAAKAAPVKAQEAPVAQAAQPAPVQESAPAKAPAKKAAKAAPVKAQEAPAAKPAPVQESTPAKAPAKKAAKAAPVKGQEAPVAKPAQPAPVQESAPVSTKAWIGTKLTGKGWTITFDGEAGRTRVQVEGTPSDAQKAAIENAGFYWSSRMNTWNKGLTCKAYRAAIALAAALAALA